MEHNASQRFGKFGEGIRAASSPALPMSPRDDYVDDRLRGCARGATDRETVMVAMPAEYMDLLQQKATFAHLATIMPNGTPQVTPVWFDYTNGKIRVNSAKGRVKARNMREGAPVALSIMDPDNPYRYIQIRGRVEHVTEEGASAHIDSLAKKYLGQDKYPWAEPDQVRITFQIEPTAVQAQG
jgi:PPOX class probable F420-dependent enzyme